MERSAIMLSKVLSVILFAVIARGATALSCYECNTGHPGCIDPFNSTGIATVNCSALYYSSRENEFGVRAASLEPLNEDYSRASDSAQYECFAYHTTFVSNHTEVVRGCRIVDSDLCGVLVNASVGAGYTVSGCLTCQQDYCNAAGITKSAVALLLVSVAAAFVGGRR